MNCAVHDIRISPFDLDGLAKRLKDLIKATGLSQKEFAKRMSVAPGYLSEILSAKKTPSDKVLKVMSQRLGIREHWLKTGEGEGLAEVVVFTGDVTDSGDAEEWANLIASARGNFTSTGVNILPGNHDILTIENPLVRREPKKTAPSGSAAESTGQYKEKHDDPVYVNVPRYRVEASAGGGSYVESEQIVDYLQFKQDWLTSFLGVSPNELALISVIGDSMSPTYNDGDLILVDTSGSRPMSDAVYVIQHQGYLWVKRLNFRLDGTIHVISDNPKYPEQLISGGDLDRLKVVGRVMWKGGR